MSHTHTSDFHRIEIRNDPVTGLHAIFALHDLTLGPALGGVRRWAYANDGEALADVARLARGMTAKNALAELPFGGGKTVILAPGDLAPGCKCGPPNRAVTQPQLLRLGEWIEELGGDYVAAEDVGMRVSDLAIAGGRTKHVTGIGQGGRGGDPGPRTALGVFAGIKVVARRLGFDQLRGVRVAVQGLGSVGMALCQLLHSEGARLVVADIDRAKVTRARERFRATGTAVRRVLLADVDIVAPCALGGAVTMRVVETMRARGIAGSANNQLAQPQVGAALKNRGVLYAPDYVINAGGVISAGLEYLGLDGFEHKARGIGERLEHIFAESAATGEPEHAVAEAMARRALRVEQAPAVLADAA